MQKPKQNFGLSNALAGIFSIKYLWTRVEASTGLHDKPSYTTRASVYLVMVINPSYILESLVRPVKDQRKIIPPWVSIIFFIYKAFAGDWLCWKDSAKHLDVF